MIVPMLTGAVLAAPAQARPCPRLVPPGEVRFDHFTIDFAKAPQRDRAPYPDARARVTCRVDDATGRLRHCVTTLADDRGPWLVGQIEHLKLVKRKPGGCPLGGRFYRLTVRFEHTD